MKFLDARQDFRRSMDALPGTFAKLLFLRELKDRNGRLRHWGLENVYGFERAREAMLVVAADVTSQTLRTSLPQLCLEMSEVLPLETDRLLRESVDSELKLAEATDCHIEYQDFCFSKLKRERK